MWDIGKVEKDLSGYSCWWMWIIWRIWNRAWSALRSIQQALYLSPVPQLKVQGAPDPCYLAGTFIEQFFGRIHVTIPDSCYVDGAVVKQFSRKDALRARNDSVFPILNARWSGTEPGVTARIPSSSYKHNPKYLLRSFVAHTDFSWNGDHNEYNQVF